jgi:hypothetical protein
MTTCSVWTNAVCSRKTFAPFCASLTETNTNFHYANFTCNTACSFNNYTYYISRGSQLSADKCQVVAKRRAMHRIRLLIFDKSLKVNKFMNHLYLKIFKSLLMHNKESISSRIKYIKQTLDPLILEIHCECSVKYRRNVWC